MTAPIFNIGIIGCGRVGCRRAQNLGAQGRLYACADSHMQSAKALAQAYNALVFTDWRDLLQQTDVHVVVVATPHNLLTPITKAAIEAGKHVLVEKPAARTVGELETIMAAAERAKVKVRVGFNHRYHSSLLKAKELIDAGVLGDLMFIRGRYGHGGRLGYEKEWRSEVAISGGGELIDQGPHMIDLSRWFLGDFSDVKGSAHTYFWNMPVEDNAFLVLTTERQQTAFVHVSCTEWKNLFSLEIYGKKGKLDLSGLGGSYGPETITWYAMLPEMGPPESKVWEYPSQDLSWALEMEDFYKDISHDRSPSATLLDAHAVLKIIETIYKDSGYDYCAQPS